jgi:hypothetical protein
MEERNNVDIDTTKVSPVDTKRFEAEDDSGHIIGSHQAMDNEQEIESFRAKENDDKGGFNKLDDRETVSGTEAV